MSATSTLLDVTVNGQSIATGTATLGDLLAELGYGGAKVATAVNGTFVAAKQRTATRLAPGDHIEIVSARQGG